MFCRGKVRFAVEKYVLPWKSKFCRGKVSFAMENYVLPWKSMFCRGKCAQPYSVTMGLNKLYWKLDEVWCSLEGRWVLNCQSIAALLDVFAAIAFILILQKFNGASSTRAPVENQINRYLCGTWEGINAVCCKFRKFSHSYICTSKDDKGQMIITITYLLVRLSFPDNLSV